MFSFWLVWGSEIVSSKIFDGQGLCFLFWDGWMFCEQWPVRSPFGELLWLHLNLVQNNNEGMEWLTPFSRISRLNLQFPGAMGGSNICSIRLSRFFFRISSPFLSLAWPAFVWFCGFCISFPDSLLDPSAFSGWTLLGLVLEVWLVVVASLYLATRATQVSARNLWLMYLDGVCFEGLGNRQRNTIWIREVVYLPGAS